MRYASTLLRYTTDMAEAEHSGGGDGEIEGWIIVIVLIFFVGLWLRGGGWHRLITGKFNFGWQPVASSTSVFPFVPDFYSLAPHVPIPTGPEGPHGPDPYDK